MDANLDVNIKLSSLGMKCFLGVDSNTGILQRYMIDEPVAMDLLQSKGR